MVSAQCYNTTGMKTMLKVGINKWFPYIIGTTINGTETYTGFCMDLLNILADTLNFSYTLVLPPDGEWGDNRDGNWTGLVGMLENKELDLIAAPILLSAERDEVVDWSMPFDYIFNTVAVRKVDNPLGQWGAFLKPFIWQIYVSTLCIWLCCTCLLYGLVIVEHRMFGHQHTMSFSSVTEFLYGSFIQRAMPQTWSRGSTRLFAASWCLLGLVLTSCYTSKLTSLLVNVTSSLPFTSLEEMAKRDDYRWGMVAGSRPLMSLRQSRDHTLQTVYQRMMTFAKDDPDVLHSDPEVHLAKILKGGYAFISDSPALNYMAFKHCEIAVLDTRMLGLEYYVFMTQKNSTLTGHIDRLFLRLQDGGVMSYLRNKWLPPQFGCQGNRSSPYAITLATLQGPYYVAVAGLVLAAGVLLLERGLHRWLMSRCCR